MLLMSSKKHWVIKNCDFWKLFKKQKEITIKVF